MSDENKMIDLNRNSTEASSNAAKTELTDDELSKVTGGDKSIEAQQQAIDSTKQSTALNTFAQVLKDL